MVRTQSRVATSIRLAAVRRTADGFNPLAADARPEGGARCVSSARRDLCGGRGAILVPTATIGRGDGIGPVEAEEVPQQRHRCGQRLAVPFVQAELRQTDCGVGKQGEFDTGGIGG